MIGVMLLAVGRVVPARLRAPRARLGAGLPVAHFCLCPDTLLKTVLGVGFWVLGCLFFLSYCPTCGLSGVRARRGLLVLHWTLGLNCLRAFGLLVCQRRGAGQAVAVVQGAGADRAAKIKVKNGQYKQKNGR